MSRQFSSETRDMPPSVMQQDTNEEHCDPSPSSTALEETSDYHHGKMKWHYSVLFWQNSTAIMYWN